MRERVARGIWVAMPYFLCLLVGGTFLGGWYILHRSHLSQEEARFREYTDLLVQETRSRMAQTAYLSRGFAGLIMGQGAQADPGLWSSYYDYRSVREEFPWVMAVAFAPRLPAQEAAAHVARMRATGAKDYAIYPEGSRETFFPMQFIAPLPERAVILGYDLSTDPVRRACLETACDTGTTIISPLTTLTHLTPPIRGVFLSTPVYMPGARVDSPEARRAALSGFVTMGISSRGLMERKAPDTTPLVDYAIYDGEVMSPDTMIFASPGMFLSRNAMFSTTRGIETNGRRWTIRLRTTPLFESRVDNSAFYTILLASMVTTLLILLVFLQEDKVRRKAQAMAESMTAALRAGEERYRALTESLPVGVALLGPGMEVLASNAALRGWFPAIKADRTGLCYQLLRIPPGRRACENCRPAQVMDDEVPRVWEEEMQTARGPRVMRVSAVPHILREGGAPCVTLVMEDVTDRMRVEEARIAQTAAEQSARAKTMFLANMSHEIRTPLNALIGFTYVLQKDPDATPRQGEILRTMEQSGRHLLKLINDILDFSKLDAGFTSAEDAPFSLRALLGDIHAMFTARAAAKGLWLRLEAADGVPDHVRGDEGRLRQVLMNLLGNAVKFTQQGGATLHVNCDGAGPGVDPVRVHFEVEDTGPGLSPDDLKGIFGEFEQGSAGRRAGGTGLGLAISLRLVRMLGGELTATNRPGLGCSFRFWATLRPADPAEPAPERPAGHVLHVAPDTARRRILAVDDSEESRVYLRELLAPAGFEVMEARDGREAVELFKRHGADLVLMDLRMPGMDGAEAIRRIRGLGGGGATAPAVAVTAHVDADREAEALAAGATCFLSKPFPPEALFDLLGRLLGVEYVHAEPSPGEAEESAGAPADREAFAHLPREVLEPVRRAAEEGDARGLDRAILGVEELDGEAGHALRVLAARYGYLEIVRPTTREDVEHG